MVSPRAPCRRPASVQARKLPYTACRMAWLATCAAKHHTLQCAAMIRSFRHSGLEQFFRTGSKAGIQPHHASKLRLMLATLDNATSPKDMGASRWRLHPLGGDLAGHWAVWVSGNWRLTFRFIGADAELVDYQDYH